MINTLVLSDALRSLIRACNTCRVTLLGLFSLSACLAHDRYFCTDKYQHWTNDVDDAADDGGSPAGDNQPLPIAPLSYWSNKWHLNTRHSSKSIYHQEWWVWDLQHSPRTGATTLFKSIQFVTNRMCSAEPRIQMSAPSNGCTIPFDNYWFVSTSVIRSFRAAFSHNS